MTENTKTFALIAAAAAILFLAFASRPAPPSIEAQDVVGKPLFPDLSNPLAVKRMKVVSFDEGTSRAREFEVAQDGKSWSLPSHKNYPADAKDQVAAAVAALVDVKYLGPAVSKNPSDHELYGVVEPKPADDQFGHKGVGKLVVLEDGSGKPLARVIIGKEDKSPKAGEEGSPPQSQLRFVRIPGQDAVYRVAMRTDKFSTKFEDWIETDLLKLNPWDVSEITLHDYSLTQGITRDGELRTVPMPRADIDVAFDDKTQKWTLKELTEYKDNKPAKEQLGEAEELDLTHLNELKNALGSLKIIDVARKPAQLSAKLKADTGAITEESFRDLASRGFSLVPVGENEVELLSSDGEAVVRMKDGVEYVLRFGKVAGIESSTDDDEKKSDEKKTDAAKKDEKKNTPAAAAKDKNGDSKANEKDDKTDAVAKSDEKASATQDSEKSDSETTAGDKKDVAKKDKGAALSRYIMVMAQFNPDLIQKPELEALPEIKKAPDAANDKTGAQDKKDAAKNDQPKNAAGKKGDTKSDAKSGEKSAAKSGDKKADPAKGDAKDAKKDAAKSDAAKSTDAGKSAKAGDAKSIDAKPTDAKSDAKNESKSADAKAGDAKSSDAKTGATADEDDQEALEAQRDKIETENKRKQADYDEKLKKGQDRAKELNARFADWYYVVNDETYHKIHLGKAEIVKKKSDDAKADAKNGKPAGPGSSPSNPFEGLQGLPNN